MGFLGDIRPAFSSHRIIFAGSSREPGNVVSFAFHCQNPVSWKPGQHGIFLFNRRMEGGSWRGFSVASSPEGGIIRIATRIGDHPSAYKRALCALNPGDAMAMRGPFGPFYLDGSRQPVVFIAGGIGITPYLAMLAHCANHPLESPPSIRLLYAGHGREYPFQREFDQLAAMHPGIRVEYLAGDELAARMEQCARDGGKATQYYLSGPDQMVRSLRKRLRGQGIKKRHIRHELFYGL